MRNFICFIIISSFFYLCSKEAPIEVTIDRRLIGVWKSSNIYFTSKTSTGDSYYTTYDGDITINIFSSGNIYAEFIYNYDVYDFNNLEETGEGITSAYTDIETLDNSRIYADNQMFDYTISGLMNNEISFTTNTFNSWSIFGSSDWIDNQLNDGYLTVFPRSFTKQ